MPSDIDPQSGFRLPLPKREELDETARQTFDEAAKPGASIAGLQGPAGVQLYSPKTTRHLRALNRYLRFMFVGPRAPRIARSPRRCIYGIGSSGCLPLCSCMSTAVSIAAVPA